MENRMSKVCVVGCKLVNGIILESGYAIKDGNVVRLPEYKRVRLQGTNQSRLVNGVTNAPLHLTPGITENVDEDFFDKWLIDHAESNIVKNGLIWKAKNKSEALAKAADETHEDTGFEPRNPKNLGGDLKPRSDDDE
jgi:hypothetical protein